MLTAKVLLYFENFHHQLHAHSATIRPKNNIGTRSITIIEYKLTTLIVEINVIRHLKVIAKNICKIKVKIIKCWNLPFGK